MDFVEAEGDTIDAAIENALKLLGVERDKITVDIISEGRKGILGFGAQKAKIRAELRKSVLDRKAASEPKPNVAEAVALPAESAAVVEKAQAALREILQLMGVKATVDQTRSPNDDETILEIASGLQPQFSVDNYAWFTSNPVQQLVGTLASPVPLAPRSTAERKSTTPSRSMRW